MSNEVKSVTKGKKLSALEQLQAKKAEYEALMAELGEAAKAEETALVEKRDTFLATLPDKLGVADINAAQSLAFAYLICGTVSPEMKEQELRNEFVAFLPRLLGVADMATVRNLVVTYAKHGTIAPASKSVAALNSAGGKYSRGQTIPPEVKAECCEMLNAGKQPSEIIEKHGVSPGTVHLWKKALGLVKSRETATVAAPATASAPQA